MLEYVFFHAQPCERFVDYVRGLGLVPRVETGDGTWEVALPETLTEEQEELVEARYDELFDEDRRLHEAEAGDDGYHTAGVLVDLSNGQKVQAEVDPELLARILSVLTPEEFGRVVSAIVDAVESPDPRSLCQRRREEGGD